MRKSVLQIFVAALLMSVTPSVADEWRAMPSGNVYYAYRHFTGGLPMDEPDGALILLRTFVMIQADDQDYIDANRRFLIENNWDPEFVAIFDSVVRWFRDTRANNPDQFYQVSKDYRRRNREAKTKSQAVKTLASLLRTMTLEWGSREVRYEIAGDLLSSPSAKDRERGLLNLESVARDGHVPAQIDMANRYLSGRGFARNLGRAYSWLLRARCHGGDVSVRLKDLETKLPLYEIEIERKLFSDTCRTL